MLKEGGAMKLKLDIALGKIGQPKAQGEAIRGLPCDCCNREHTRVKAVEVEGCLVWEIHSHAWTR